MAQLSLAKLKSFAPCSIALRAVLLCLVFRALIPVGFMPSFGENENGSRSLVTLCHGDAGSAQLMSLLDDSVDISSGAPGVLSHHQQCAFSAFAALGLAHDIGFIAVFFIVPEFAEFSSIATLAIFYSPQHARAPPVFTGKLIPV